MAASGRARSRTTSSPSGMGGASSIIALKMLASLWRKPGRTLMLLAIIVLGLNLWAFLHPASWNACWGAVGNVLHLDLKHVGKGTQGSQGRSPSRANWIDGVSGIWWWVERLSAPICLMGIGLYVGHAVWTYRRYTHVWLPAIREERLYGGGLLEVQAPKDSKADAAVAMQLYGRLWQLLSVEAKRRGIGLRAGASSASSAPGSQSIPGATRIARIPGSLSGERAALSLEMWSSSAGISFYIWCPDPQDDALPGDLMRVVQERVISHFPACRVRPVLPGQDPFSRAVLPWGIVPSGLPPGEAPSVGADVHETPPRALIWYELGLEAPSRYPISEGGMSAGTGTGAANGRTAVSQSVGGAGADPLAAVLGALVTEAQDGVTLLGVQVVAAPVGGGSGIGEDLWQQITQEREQLRQMEMMMPKKALGSSHEERLLALEDKSDRSGFDVLVRLVAVAEATDYGVGRAQARLQNLVRSYSQYTRRTAGVTQRFILRSSGNAILPALKLTEGTNEVPAGEYRQRLEAVSAIAARWPRQGIGVSLPRSLSLRLGGNPSILNCRELSSVYHPPHEGMAALPKMRWKMYKQLPPPAGAIVRPSEVEAGTRVILGLADEDLSGSNNNSRSNGGRNGNNGNNGNSGSNNGNAIGKGSNALHSPALLLPGGMRAVGNFPEDWRQFGYMQGGTGSGKTWLAVNLAQQYMDAGRGVGVIDGKNDLYDRVLERVPPEREHEVLVFNPGNKRIRRTIGVNPLDRLLIERLGASEVASRTFDLIGKVGGGNMDGAVRIQRILRWALPAVLEGEPYPTLDSLARFLDDAHNMGKPGKASSNGGDFGGVYGGAGGGGEGGTYFEQVLSRVRTRRVRDFWLTAFASWPNEKKATVVDVLTRLERFTTNSVARYVIVQPHSTVNLQYLMDQGYIFAAKVGTSLGKDNQEFLGALLMNQLLMSAFSRTDIPEDDRRDFFLIVDEFQKFVTMDIDDMLSQARSFRLNALLSHQFTGQLSDGVLKSILANAKTVILFGLKAEDARIWAKILGEISTSDLLNLPPYYMYLTTLVNGQGTGTFSAAPLPIPPVAYNPGSVTPMPGALPGTETHDAAVPGWRIPRELRSLKTGLHDIPAQVRELLAASNPGSHADEAPRGQGMRIEKLVRLMDEAEAPRDQGMRIEKLVGLMYGAVEEGEPWAVSALSCLSQSDRAIYRELRKRRDVEEWKRLRRCPWLERDKRTRIERLSALRWATPHAEIEAEGEMHNPDGSNANGPYGPDGHGSADTISGVKEYRPI